MSGGYFEYNQYIISDLKDDIENLIDDNDSETLDLFGYPKGNFYSPETIDKFKETVKVLEKAYIMVKRIDWLLSGDDGEENFHERLNEELGKIN